jgi:hypothetical protein
MQLPRRADGALEVLGLCRWLRAALLAGAGAAEKARTLLGWTAAHNCGHAGRPAAPGRAALLEDRLSILSAREGGARVSRVVCVVCYRE